MKKSEDFFEIYEKLFKSDFKLAVAYENKGGGSDVTEEKEMLENSEERKVEEVGRGNVEGNCGDGE